MVGLTIKAGVTTKAGGHHAGVGVNTALKLPAEAHHYGRVTRDGGSPPRWGGKGGGSPPKAGHQVYHPGG